MTPKPPAEFSPPEALAPHERGEAAPSVHDALRMGERRVRGFSSFFLPPPPSRRALWEHTNSDRHSRVSRSRGRRNAVLEVASAERRARPSRTAGCSPLVPPGVPRRPVLMPGHPLAIIDEALGLRALGALLDGAVTALAATRTGYRLGFLGRLVLVLPSVSLRPVSSFTGIPIPVASCRTSAPGRRAELVRTMGISPLAPLGVPRHPVAMADHPLTAIDEALGLRALAAVLDGDLDAAAAALTATRLRYRLGLLCRLALILPSVSLRLACTLVWGIARTPSGPVCLCRPIRRRPRRRLHRA